MGLGNPGPEYAATRHNIGFMLLDRMAMRRGEWRREKTWNALVTQVDGVLLVKPQTYMNLSGEAVSAVMRFYKIPVESVLVVLDDMALGLGRIRWRGAGSSGGHNGLRSIIQQLGTEAVARLRLGIGGSAPGEAVGHVLGKFRKDELERLEELLERAEESIRVAQTDGLEKAMNAFN